MKLSDLFEITSIGSMDKMYEKQLDISAMEYVADMDLYRIMKVYNISST